jgi:hypothetical protein
MKRKQVNVHINLSLATLVDEVCAGLSKNGPTISRRLLVEMILSDALVSKKTKHAPHIEKREQVPQIDDMVPDPPKRKPDNETITSICNLIQRKWATLTEMQDHTRKSRRIVEAVAEDLVSGGFAEKRTRARNGRGRPATEYSIKNPTC